MHPFRLSSKSTHVTNAGEDVEKRVPCYRVSGNVNCNIVSCELVWKAVWRFLRKLKIDLPYDLAIPFLSLYLEKKQKREVQSWLSG